MNLWEKRYKRCFEKADYGKIRNAIYDIVNKIIGFTPSAVLKYEIIKELTK